MYATRASISVVAAVLVAATPNSQPAGHRFTTQPAATVRWAPCQKLPSTDCATISVPVDWSDLTGPATTLALARHRATDPAARVGTLMVNPGGPGGSGVLMVSTYADRFFSDTLRRRFDLIGFDPRGIGVNPPVTCATGGLTGPTTVFPASRAEFAAATTLNRRLLAGCRATTGPLTDHMSGADVARDVEAIRIALGGQPLSWYGTSYGTEIGQRYAELFPHHIRAMVLDATIDHGRSAFTHLLASTASAEDTFNRFSRWCRRARTCALHGHDAGAVLDAVMARAGTRALLLNGTTYRADDVRTLVYRDLYVPAQGWPVLGALLRALRSAPAVTRPPATQPPDPHQSVRAAICADWNYQLRDYQELSTVLTAARALAPHLGIADVPGRRMMICQSWPVTDPPHRLDVHTPTPIVLVNSEHDPMTPYSGAVDVQRQIPGSILLTYRGDGHTTYTQSPCIRTYVDDYLTTLTTPSPGTRCPT